MTGESIAHYKITAKLGEGAKLTRNPIESAPFRHNLFQRPDERRQVVFKDLPHNVEIHAVITVDQTVAKARDLGSGNFRPKFAVLSWDSGCGFSDYLQQSNERQIQLPVRVKVRSGLSLHHLGSLSGVLEHVKKPACLS